MTFVEMYETFASYTVVSCGLLGLMIGAYYDGKCYDDDEHPQYIFSIVFMICGAGLVGNAIAVFIGLIVVVPIYVLIVVGITSAIIIVQQISYRIGKRKKQGKKK